MKVASWNFVVKRQNDKVNFNTCLQYSFSTDVQNNLNSFESWTLVLHELKLIIYESQFYRLKRNGQIETSRGKH